MNRKKREWVQLDPNGDIFAYAVQCLIDEGFTPREATRQAKTWHVAKDELTAGKIRESAAVNRQRWLDGRK